MSGGSYDYSSYTFKEEYSGRMYDPELNCLVNDLAEVLHDVEWWQSGDISEEDYRETVKAFKERWFGDRSERLEKIISDKCEELKSDLLKML